MKQHQTNSFISRAAAMLLTVIMAFAGAQTARATTYSISRHSSCNVEMTFSVNGVAATEAEPGQRVDVELPMPGDNAYWKVLLYPNSSPLSIALSITISQHDVNKFHFTMPEQNVYVSAKKYDELTILTAYPVFDNSTHGHVEVNGAEAGTEKIDVGSTVTLRPVADSGYEYASISATYAGVAITLTDNGDGTWSFTMPASMVRVSQFPVSIFIDFLVGRKPPVAVLL